MPPPHRGVFVCCAAFTRSMLSNARFQFELSDTFLISLPEFGYFLCEQRKKHKSHESWAKKCQKEMPRTGLEPVTFCCNDLTQLMLRHCVLDRCDNPTTLTRLDVQRMRYCLYRLYGPLPGPNCRACTYLYSTQMPSVFCTPRLPILVACWLDHNDLKDRNALRLLGCVTHPDILSSTRELA